MNTRSGTCHIFTNGSQSLQIKAREQVSCEFIKSRLKAAKSEKYSIGDIGMFDKLVHLPNDNNWMAIN